MLQKFQKKTLTFLLLILILVSAIFFLKNNKRSSFSKNILVVTSSNSNYLKTDKFFDKELFNVGLTEVNKLNFGGYSSIKFAVFPHHTVPSYLISGALSNIQAKHIILLGPDHKDIGTTPFTISDIGWDTYFGKVAVNNNLKSLMQKNLSSKVLVNNPLVEDEHSIGGIVPYIKYHNNDTDLFSIVVSPKVSIEDLYALATFIKNNMEDTAIVAAIDFSHYLNNDQAQSKDLETRDYILNKKYNSIFNLKSDHLDDPKSLIVILKLAELNNLKTNIIENTNSGLLLKQPFNQTTSYFLITFTP